MILKRKIDQNFAGNNLITFLARKTKEKVSIVGLLAIIRYQSQVGIAFTGCCKPSPPPPGHPIDCLQEDFVDICAVITIAMGIHGLVQHLNVNESKVFQSSSTL